MVELMFKERELWQFCWISFAGLQVSLESQFSRKKEFYDKSEKSWGKIIPSNFNFSSTGTLETSCHFQIRQNFIMSSIFVKKTIHCCILIVSVLVFLFSSRNFVWCNNLCCWNFSFDFFFSDFFNQRTACCLKIETKISLKRRFQRSERSFILTVFSHKFSRVTLCKWFNKNSKEFCCWSKQQR